MTLIPLIQGAIPERRMEIILRYQGISESPWMNRYFTSKLERLGRYLPSNSSVVAEFRAQSSYSSTLIVKTPKHEYQFRKEGKDLYEAFTHMLEEAMRVLKKEHQQVIERFHRVFSRP